MNRAAAAGVVGQARGEVEGDRLPAQGPALLPQPQHAVVAVEVGQAQSEGAAAAGGGFGVQPEQDRVQGDVIAAGAGGQVDLGEFPVGQRAADAWQAAGVWRPGAPG